MISYTEEIKQHFENLKDSPIINDEFYNALANLCGAIISISGHSLVTIDYLADDETTSVDGLEKLCGKYQGVPISNMYYFGDYERTYNAQGLCRVW